MCCQALPTSRLLAALRRRTQAPRALHAMAARAACFPQAPAAKRFDALRCRWSASRCQASLSIARCCQHLLVHQATKRPISLSQRHLVSSGARRNRSHEAALSILLASQHCGASSTGTSNPFEPTMDFTRVLTEHDHQLHSSCNSTSHQVWQGGALRGMVHDWHVLTA